MCEMPLMTASHVSMPADSIKTCMSLSRRPLSAQVVEGTPTAGHPGRLRVDRVSVQRHGRAHAPLCFGTRGSGAPVIRHGHCLCICAHFSLHVLFLADWHYTMSSRALL